MNDTMICKWKKRLKAVFTLSLVIVILVTSIPLNVHAASNADTIFSFLKSEMGLNSAAACGVLANIEKESSFNPNIYGDEGTSYGICQWHNSRFTALKNWCGANGYDYTTLWGQLNYLKFELSANNSNYLWNGKTIYNKLAAVSNTADGAYSAAYDWCYYYEVPANKEIRSQERGNLAKSKYWPRYGDGTPAPTVSQSVNCKYVVTVAANSGVIPLYESAATLVSSQTNALKNSAVAYNVYCTQKVVLSDGTVRYFFVDADGNPFYFTWNSGVMTMIQKHNWSSWKTTQSATCTTFGQQKRTCSCGAYETKIIAKLGHNYESSWTIDTAATCTKEGSKSRHCTRCSAKTEVTAIAKEAHSYGAWKTTKSASCTVNGTQKRTCSCGAYETKSIAKLGHSYGEWVTVEASTCTTTGTKKRTCSCGAYETESIGVKGHSFSDEWTIDQMAVDGHTVGSKSRHCTRCSAKTDVTTIPAPGANKLTATNGDSGVTLKWTKATGADRYRLYRSVYENGEWSTWKYWDVTRTPIISDVEAENGKIYRHRVAFVDADGNQYATITSNTILRLTNRKLSVSNGVSGVTLKWSAVKQAAKYRTYRSAYIDGAWSAWEYWDVTKTPIISDVDAKSGTIYKYQVRVQNNENTTIATLTSGSIRRLAMPKVTATNAASAAKVTWKKVKGASSYAVYRSYYYSGKWSSWARFKTTTATSWTDTTAKNGVKYRYMVRAIKSDDMSVATTGDILTRLTTPTTKASKVTKGIKVSWNKNSSAKQYYVYRSYYAGGSWSKWVKMKTTTAASWTDTTAKKGVKYRYMARTVKNGDLSYYKVSSGIKR